MSKIEDYAKQQLNEEYPDITKEETWHQMIHI